MTHRLLADLVVLVHLAFVVFVLSGGLLVLRWRWIAWLHLPAAAWGMIVEFSGWICPLTPLENWLRLQGDERAYSSDFIAHYVLPVLYPTGLTQNVQFLLGALVLVVNLAIYGRLWHRMRGRGTAERR